MTTDQAVDLVRESMLLMLIVSGPVLGAALVVGLLISLFQAVTQLQEQTLTFVPKIVGMTVVGMLLAPWGVQMLMDFTAKVISGH